MGFCDGDWFTTVYYSDSVFSVLQPQKAADCDSNTVNSTDFATELGYIVPVTMFIGLCFLGTVLGRSCSKIYIDWFRLVLYYVIATIAVPLSIALSPPHGGFNRIIAFGIMIHNLSEWFIISRIWVGQLHINALPAVIYITVFLILIVILPLQPLFLIAMVQGAFCDWTLVFSFYYMRYWLQKGQEIDFKKDTICYSWLGFSAALLHIVSIQPLFIGIALTYSVLNGITVMLLVPTFVLYTFFASNGGPNVRPNIVAPTFKTAQFAITRGIYNTLQVISRRASAKKSVELKKETEVLLATSNSGDDQKNDEQKVDTSAVEMNVLQGGDRVDDRKEERLELSMLEVASRQTEAMAAEALKKNIYTAVIYYGLIEMDPEDNERWQTIIYVAAFFTAFANSLIAFFMPCMVDVESLICE